MKLVEIWNSATAWGTLSVLKKNPKLAYRLLKYEKKVEREMKVVTEHREALVCKHAGVSSLEHGQVVTLAESTPECLAFHAEFNEFCQQESDLKWIGISMDELIEGLHAENGNVISEHDIELLEPFFTEPAKADLRLVDSSTGESKPLPA